MRYIRCIIRSGIFDKVWKSVLILVIGGLETVAILKEICDGRKRRRYGERKSLSKLRKYNNKVMSDTSDPFMKQRK